MGHIFHPANFLAKLDYPPAPVMLGATVILFGFIIVGGWLFRAADLRHRAELAQARQDASTE